MENRSNDITEEIRRLIVEKLNTFNGSKSADKGRYFILLPTEKTVYYTLWFFNPEAMFNPYIYLSLLDMNAIGSVSKAIKMIANSFYPLSISNDSNISFSNGDDIITFGKYRRHHLVDIYTIDPKYILWIADKYEAHVKSEQRFKELAVSYSRIYLDLNTRRKYKAPVSQYIGTPGEKLTALSLTIIRIRLEDNPYKTKIVGGMEYFYVDQLLTAVDTAGNLFVLTLKATDRSLTSHTLALNDRKYKTGDKINLTSAKVMKHFESHKIKYTRLGYVKITEEMV